MRPHRVRKIARGFLRTPQARGRDTDVGHFHRWLEKEHLTLATVVPMDLDRYFTRPFGKWLAPSSRVTYRSQIYPYLDWLHAHGYLGFDSRAVRVCAYPLPDVAHQFLAALAITRKPYTCEGYRVSIRSFHRWLNQRAKSLATLTRPTVIEFAAHLALRKLHPITRLHMLSDLRVYLRWLAEQSVIAEDGDHLLRPSDFPKPPRYLPRPLPPDVDREIQRRLAQIGDRYALGVLLMRATGLRVGELCSLAYDCVRTDFDGNHFLKVPLGKLDSERLVPMDGKAVELVRRLQSIGTPGRSWLIESIKGRKTIDESYRRVLKQVRAGLENTDGPITPHRLRHTYATALLAGGMSLLGVMKLLGHRDFRMTLRYTAITQETLGREYRDALVEIEKKYQTPAPLRLDPEPIKMLSDLIAWIQNHLGRDRHARALTKRLLRIQKQIRFRRA